MTKSRFGNLLIAIHDNNFLRYINGFVLNIYIMHHVYKQNSDIISSFLPSVQD